MKIRFIDYYMRFSVNTNSSGNTSYGNYLFYPLNTLISILESKYGCSVVNDDSFDTIVVSDMDQELYDYVKKLSPSIKKILILTESVIYTPLAHCLDIMSDTLWYKVLTYNRELKTKSTIYYDIPVTGIQMPITVKKHVKENGCFIATYKKNDVRGYTSQRDNLISILSQKQLIDVYGAHWKLKRNYYGKTDNKIETISQYHYNVAFENAKYSGYVTEKIGDSILAEVPCIYFGDTENAKRRFGDTFVSVDELTFECFQNAVKKLNDNYQYYLNNVIQQKKDSITWCDSYLDSMIKAIIQ